MASEAPLLDNEAFLTLFVFLLAYGGCIAVSALRGSHSQLNDYGGIALQDVQADLPVTLDELCGLVVHKPNRIDLGALMKTYLLTIPCLRVLAYMPVFFFIFAFGIFLAEKSGVSVFVDRFSPGNLINALTSLGILALVSYLIIKVRSNMTQHLLCCHARYSNASFLWVLLDVIPALRRPGAA